MHFIPAPSLYRGKKTSDSEAGIWFRPSVICPASMMQDTAPSIAKQLSYEGFPKRKS